MAQQHTKGTPLTLPLQLSSLFLFGVSIVAALWLRGNAHLVLGILVLLLPAGMLARLPRHWFPSWSRQVLQVVVAGCGLAWWVARLGGGTVDIVLVETTAVLGLALAIGGVPREYGFMGLISLILVGYGGLTPGRSPYLPALGIYVAFGILVMYQTRTLNLKREYPAGGQVVKPYIGNWGYRVAHLALVCTLLLLLLVFFPRPQGRSVGIVPVDFSTQPALQFTLPWQNWFGQSRDVIAGRWNDAMQMADTADMEPEEVTPDTSTSTAAAMTPTDDDENFDSRPGPGGTGMGTDVILRVRSPAKLYWLAQLYDVYNGAAWVVSESLARQNRILDRYEGASCQSVTQLIRLEKVVSTRLPGAFRATDYTWETDGTTTPETKNKLGKALIRVDAGGADVIGPPPEAFWQYRCVSHVPTLDARVSMPTDLPLERLAGAYLRLPEALISDRLRRLARDVTGDCVTPMERALALQRHLRETYTYRLDVPKIPLTAEPVDYFLFESREGYCQHFAQAFTVLARLAGLPARLATGYSPGDYDLLTGTFEVREYHAHAWTQIFIKPYGWLTFDGVAPGDLELDTNPGFLKRFMDPFGDDWGARPPELAVTGKTQRSVADGEKESGPARPLAKAAENVYRRAALESRTTDPDARALGRALGATLKEWFAAQWTLLIQAVGGWFDSAAMGAVGAVHAVLVFVLGLSAASSMCALAFAGMLLTLWFKRHSVLLALQARYTMWRFRRCWRRFESVLQRTSMDMQALVCWEMMRYAVSLGSSRRPVGMDMLEYAAWLTQSRRRLGEACGAIVQVASVQLYAGHLPPQADIARAVEAVAVVGSETLKSLESLGFARPGGTSSSRARQRSSGTR